MDSPLLPTIRRDPNLSTSLNGMTSDLSLMDDSFQPSSSRDPYTSSRDVEEVREIRSKPRFSLFAPSQEPTREELPRHPQQRGEDGNGAADRDAGEDEDEETEEVEQSARPGRLERSTQREDKLRESLYELRQMNEVFDMFLHALEAARGHNQRVATRVKETSHLLDMYTALLGQTEHTQRLLLNPKWTGAQDDAAALAAEEAAKMAEEEAAARARLAEQERVERLEREKESREASSTRGGGRGRGIPQPTRGKPGLKKPSGGLGGQYANVKSSGYGRK